MSHHLQDHFMCERFLLLALLAPVWELGNDGTEGRSEERGAAHVEVGRMENWNEAAFVSSSCNVSPYMPVVSVEHGMCGNGFIKQCPVQALQCVSDILGYSQQSRSIINLSTPLTPKLTCLPLELAVLRNEVLLHPVNRTQGRKNYRTFL